MILPSLALAGTLALALTAEATFGAAAPPHPPSGYKRSHKAMSVRRTINETIATLPEDLAFYNEAVERVRQGGRPRKRQAAACGTDVPAVPAPSNLPPIAGTSESPKFNSTWRLDHEASGASFFNDWDFWTADDPTHGTVDYVSASDAWNQGLIKINQAGNAIMSVDHTEQITGRGRKSVRIHSDYKLNGGLMLMDSVHMPTGCGSWPAFWTYGPNWPQGGEIDILEGVNDFAWNQVSLHTGDGCKIPASFSAAATTELTTGNFDNLNCGSYATSNQGCGQRTKAPNSYGKSFNQNGGGVYALKWDASGISVYFFPRNAIPADIVAGTPTPETWGLPMGNFPSASCNPYEFFKDNSVIFDTTFCGDWAGNIWNDPSGYAGQSQSCAASTGYATCEEYVRNRGSAFTDAFWEVKYVKIFQPK